ncbi:MAG: hypothetical protein AB1593_07940 [Pseudomonadota bacterium]
MSQTLIAVAVVLMLTVLVLGRRQLRKARERHIDQYDFARLLDARLAMQRTELGPQQRQLVFRALGEYFHLCRMAGRQRMVSMPSQVVDDAWHAFILFTRNYETFCQRALGRFLHHVPAEAMQSPTQAQDGIKRAWRLACLREGIDPKHPSRLPLLFSIDRDLGIADGFHYVPDCLQSVVRNDASGTPYCGSHIGCGGGCGGGCSGSTGDGSGCGGGCGGD